MKKLTKRICSILLTITLIAGGFVPLTPPMNVSAADEEYLSEDGIWSYKIDEEYVSPYGLFLFPKASGAVITGYHGPGGNVVIPDQLGGYNVIAIGERVFYENTDLISVVISDHVIDIFSHAMNGYNFAYCTNLESVTFGNSLTYIGTHAFMGCSSLTEVNLPDSVLAIGWQAFSGCSQLRTVTFGSGLGNYGLSTDAIDAKAFEYCSSLESITFKNPGKFRLYDTSEDMLRCFYSTPNLTTVYGYPGSSAEDFADTNDREFVPLAAEAEPAMTIFVTENDYPGKNLSVTDEYGQVSYPNAQGKVVFPVTAFDPNKTYHYEIHTGNSTCPFEMTGQDYGFAVLRSFNVHVQRDGEPVANANVCFRTNESDETAQQTNAEGIVNLIFTDNGGPYTINVEADDYVGQTEAAIEDIIAGHVFINLPAEAAANPTITGNVTHGSSGISGVVLTADCGDGNLLYAMTKADGSYCFILPDESIDTYTINVIETGGYDKGVLTITEKNNVAADSINHNFVFEDGIRLTGTVKNTQNQPLPGTCLYLEKDNQVWSAAADESGSYQFTALADGTYRLYYGKTGNIYNDGETIVLTGDTVKNIILTGYSVTTPRNITYDISVKSPVELGGNGLVSVRCQNQDYSNYNDLILEVNIPADVMINETMLGSGQTYDSSTRKVTMPVQLGGKGNPQGTDFATLTFQYKLADNYSKNKVVFTAFARESAAAADILSEHEMTDLSWHRTDENKTVTRKTSDPIWKWSELSGLTTELTDPSLIWDGQHSNYFSMYADGSNITKDYATWKFHAAGGIEYRRFQSRFTRPDKAYEFSHILSDNYEAYSGSGAVFPINDEVFIFIYPVGTTITNNNANRYLAFWGSTQYSKYSGGKFMGVEGNKAIWYKTSGAISALQHTDYWVLDGTKNRIQEILQQNTGSTDFVIDVFASDYSQGGGMDKFNLVFTNTQIPSLDTKSSMMPYKDFIGIAHADLFQPTLTGDECITAEFLKNNAYELNGQSLQNSNVTIHNLSTKNTAVNQFFSEGYYNKGTNLAPAAGTYAFVAECTKNGVVQRSNIHVVEVQKNLELANLKLTSATIENSSSTGSRPYVNVSILTSDTIHTDVSTTFNEELKASDEVYYKLSDIKNTFQADSSLTAALSFSGTKTRYVTVVVLRNGRMIFSQIIGQIYINIDPSGYVYDKHTQKRIEGAVVTCYVKNNSAWEVWDAAAHGQQNPLITDAGGRYAWDVPEGVYKVTVSKNGFENYDTLNDIKYSYTVGQISSIVIPPPRLDINMGMKNTAEPVIVSSYPKQDTAIAPADIIIIGFNKAMDHQSLVNGITLSNNTAEFPIHIRVNNAGDVVTLVPDDALPNGTYTVTLADTIQDYVNEKSLAAAALTFRVSDDLAPQQEILHVLERELKTNADDTFTIHFNTEITFAANPEDNQVTYASLTSEDGDVLEVDVFIGQDKKSLLIHPAAPLQPSNAYTLTLSQIESIDGQTLAAGTIAVTTSAKADTPTANINSGSVQKGTKITLATDTAEAKIYYTTDGSNPTTASHLYNGIITVSENMVIKAAAFKDNLSASDVAVYEYTVGASDSMAVVPAAPAIIGPELMTLKEGYAATTSAVFTAKGSDTVTVQKTSGNSKITWDNTKKVLKIAAGLREGTYPVTLTASNGTLPNATLTFTLTVIKESSPLPVVSISGPTSKTLKIGYAATSTSAYTITGSKSVTVKKISGSKKITWNNKTKKLDIAKGLAAGTYTVVLCASEGKPPTAVLTFKLTVTKPVTAAPGTKVIPASKTVKKGANITLKAPKNTVLYYTTNGKKPTSKSKTVKAGESVKLKINKKTTVKIYAVKKNCSASKVVTRTYKVK